jgi:hypothetical protein
MADGGAGRCLYDLSDDLLRHILFLAPDRDGAATAVLSRRWRWLWRTSGAVYLDSGSFNGGCSSPDQEREAFLRGAEEALPLWLPPPPTAPSGGSRSSLRKAEDKPACRLRVEEIEVKSVNTQCTLSLGSLPSEALRVLRIFNCSSLTARCHPMPPCSQCWSTYTCRIAAFLSSISRASSTPLRGCPHCISHPPTSPQKSILLRAWCQWGGF